MNTISSNAQISGIINQYSKVTNVDATCSKVTVTDPLHFTAGNLVLIIQMKGATMSEVNAATFGTVQSINSAGNYEYQRIQAIDGNDIYFNNTLLRTYETAGSVQLVYIPEYINVTITGIVTAQAWDGNTGGIVALAASGTVTMDADIQVNGLGFRGGKSSILSSNCPTIFDVANTSYYFTATSKYAFKGEGISDFITNKTNGRGKQTNGGGGGNQHNAGGGGGSNYGNGGQGGDQSSGCSLYNTNASGGLALGTAYSIPSNKLFLGGGGGGGDQDNTNGGKGGNGGGMVFISANQILANNHTIDARGDDGDDSFGDGAGGGGGGGCVILNGLTYSNTLFITADGGNGGTSTSIVSSALGPGGGGSGGIIWLANASVPSTINTTQNGGNEGLSYYNNTTLYPNKHAAKGDAGALLLNASIPESTVLNPCTLPVSLIRFDAERKENRVLLSWTTAKEEHNTGYTIWKSIDGIQYYSIGIIAAASINSSLIHSYSYTDYNSFDPGIIYYKLSQKDIDGTVHELGIRSAILSETLFDLRLYPNPSNGSVTVESSGSELIEYTIYTADGARLMQHQPISNSFTLSDLSAGYYIIVFTFADRVEKRMFIVQ